MSQIEFYKATSGGKITSIDNSVDSLHNRRSILIKDDNNQTLWIIHGSGAAKKTKKSAETNAEDINSEHDGKYSIKHIEYDNAEEVINDILASKSQKKPTATPPTPKVPKMKSKVIAPSPKGEQDTEGPVMKEFQIAYFVEEDMEEQQSQHPDLMKQVLQVIASYVDQVDKIIDDLPSKKKATGILHSLSEEIIDLIYD